MICTHHQIYSNEDVAHIAEKGNANKVLEETPKIDIGWKGVNWLHSVKCSFRACISINSFMITSRAVRLEV